MNIYLISQNVNDGYDTFDAAVVAAPDEETARNMKPGGSDYDLDTWCKPEHVKVELIGTTERQHRYIFLASFNAG